MLFSTKVCVIAEGVGCKLFETGRTLVSHDIPATGRHQHRGHGGPQTVHHRRLRPSDVHVHDGAGPVRKNFTGARAAPKGLDGTPAGEESCGGCVSVDLVDDVGRGLGAETMLRAINYTVRTVKHKPGTST
jgi:hypothetical protein